MRKSILAMAIFLSFSCFFGNDIVSAASVGTAPRELKESLHRETTTFDERVSRILYGRSGQYGSSDRTRIAVVINGDENLVVEDRVKNQIYSQLRKKFPKEEFAVMKGTDVNTLLLQEEEERYMEQRGSFSSSSVSDESGKSASRLLGGIIPVVYEEQSEVRNSSEISKNDKLDVDGMPIGSQPRGIADLALADYVHAGKELGYDYVFAVTLSNGMTQRELHNFILFNSITNHKNVWLRVRLVDVKNSCYAYRNNILAQGETHGGGINGRIFERSVKKAMEEAMNDIEIQH